MTLLCNLQPKKGHVSGTRYIVDSMICNILSCNWKKQRKEAHFSVCSLPARQKWLSYPRFQKNSVVSLRLFCYYNQHSVRSVVQRRFWNWLSSQVLYKWPAIRFHVANNAPLTNFRLFSRQLPHYNQCCLQVCSVYTLELFYGKFICSAKEALQVYSYIVTYSRKKKITSPSYLYQ